MSVNVSMSVRDTVSLCVGVNCDSVREICSLMESVKDNVSVLLPDGLPSVPLTVTESKLAVKVPYVIDNDALSSSVHVSLAEKMNVRDSVGHV